MESGQINEADLPALHAYRAEAARLTAPCGDEAVILHVQKLRLHYHQDDLNQEASATRWDDWCDDFADMPEDILAAACRDWRRSKARFAPSPGQLLEKCVSVEVRRLLLERVETAIAMLEAR